MPYKTYGQVFISQNNAKLMQKKLLVVGIDPGVTLAYAILDIEGNIIKIESSKQLDINKIISEVIENGKVVIAGTDKSKIPGLVETFASKLGARIATPDEDLKVDEKRKLVGRIKTSNDHQFDAIASALFALKSVKPLLDKIDLLLEKTDKINLKNSVKELVLLKKISIKHAIGLLESKDEESEITKDAIAEKSLSKEDFVKVYVKMKSYEKERDILKKYNENISNRLRNIEKRKNIPME